MLSAPLRRAYRKHSASRGRIQKPEWICNNDRVQHTYRVFIPWLLLVMSWVSGGHPGRSGELWGRQGSGFTDLLRILGGSQLGEEEGLYVVDARLRIKLLYRR